MEDTGEGGKEHEPSFKPNNRKVSIMLYLKMKMGPVFIAILYNFKLYLLP